MEDKEKLKNLRAMIVLTAALIAQILNIVYKRDVVVSLLILLAVIVIFLMIANIGIWLIEKIRNMEKGKQILLPPEQKESSEEESKEEEQA